MHEKYCAQYDLCDSGVYSREIINMFFVGQVSLLVENFNIGIYSDIIRVINVKICAMVLLADHYLFIPLSITLITFQGHSNIKQCLLTILCYILKLKLCRTAKSVKQIINVPLFFTFANIQRR